MYLDCTNQNACNWMMFVRCARSLDEQNLAAYQHNGKVYFVTIKVNLTHQVVLGTREGSVFTHICDSNHSPQWGSHPAFKAITCVDMFELCFFFASGQVDFHLPCADRQVEIFK